MTPLILAGVTQSPANLNSANDNVLSANAEQYAGGELPGQFSDLVQNYIDSSQVSTENSERLEMIRGAVEDMDDSEVVGFLAMLEAQSGWTQRNGTSETHSFLSFGNGLVSGEADTSFKLPVQTQQLALQTESVAQGNSFSLAVQEALTKAREDYLPAGREQESSEVIRSSQAGASQAGASQAGASQESASLLTLTAREAEQKTVISEVGSGLSLDMASLSARADLISASTSSELASTPEWQALDGGRIASAQGKGDFSHVMQTASESLTEARSATDTRQENWGEALGQRLVMMVTEQRQEAQIRLDPPELGSLGVKLVVEERGVSIQFNSAIPQVRDMLEAQADRLRAAMSTQGLDLVDVNVGDDAQSQSNDRQPPFYAASETSNVSSLSEDDILEGQWTEVEVAAPVNPNLINTFA